MTSPTIAVVDDSRVSRMMINTIIKSRYPDAAIIEAGSADEAGQVLNDKIDLFILDFNMPGIDGLEFGKKLQASHPDTPIYLLTGNVQQSIQDRASEMSIQFCPKPITEERILGILGCLED